MALRKDIQRVLPDELQRILQRLPRYSAAEFGQWASKREQARRIERLQMLELPDRLYQLLLTARDEHGRALRLTDAVVRLREALDRHRRLIALAGTYGTGKSAAAAIVLAERSQHNRGRWIAASKYVQIAPWESETQARYMWPHLLVVDDVGQEEAAGREQKRLEWLLCERYDGARATVLTTNLSWDTFAQRYDARVRSRFREVGSWIEVRQLERPEAPNPGATADDDPRA